MFTKKKTLPYRWHVGAVALYAAAAWLFICHGLPLNRDILGFGADPLAYIWFLAWLPFALGHHLDPFYTALVWQPAGVDLAWTASIPFLAAFVMPVTLTAGPLLAYNLLVVAAPFLAACGAYALCLYITAKPPAAMLGGYVFGFSTYELAQATGHLNLDFTVAVPLLALVALARLDGRLSRPAAVLLAVLLLACQLGICLEIFATSVLFGGLAWGLAWAAYPARRGALLRLVVDGLIAAPLLLLVTVPFLWALFAHPHGASVPASWAKYYATDALNLLVPTVTTKFGGALAVPLSSHFPGLAAEQDGYFGFLLLAIIVLFCRRQNWFFGALFGAIVVLSCGPQLWLGGWATGLTLPWALGQHLPFMQAALPARFMLYAWLLAAVIAALWVAADGPDQSRRMTIGRLACLLLLPSLYPGQPNPALNFFQPGHVQAALGAQARVLILPFGILGDSSFWQAENNFGFAQTGGYLGAPPAGLSAPMLALFNGTTVPGLAPDLAAYCRRTGTQFVVAAPFAPADAVAAVRSLGWAERRVEDVTVFTITEK